ncbi:GNAT family N-acetyltransferase [Compostimonas suwonensis]|nr:GNAT family N-acetyltransferase [Compostimonas suwonensis]
MTHEVRHEPEHSRYALYVDGENVGVADYRIEGDDILFTHTEVAPALRNEGLGGELVQAALDDVRATTDLTVVPLCPFLAAWVDDHADYKELTTRGR